MSQRLTINMNNKPIYDIVYEQDFNNLVQELEPFGIREKKLCIITDSRVKGFYADEVRSLLQGNCGEVFVYDFPNGEQSKNLDTVKNIYEFLIQNKFGRKDMLLALGGGVVGDMTGFTAATYLRGVDFVQIPTTLLAQVDSSIGGKTGVDFDQYFSHTGIVLSVVECLECRHIHIHKFRHIESTYHVLVLVKIPACLAADTAVDLR